MDPLEKNEAIQQFIELLSENNRQGQATDLSALIWYMEGMTRQYEAVLHELEKAQRQLASVQEPSVKDVLHKTIADLGEKAHQIKDTLDTLWEKIAGYAAAAVKNFQEMGVKALDTAVSALGVKNALESLQENIDNAISNTGRNIEKVESIGQELRSAGSHLRNAGRAAAGKEVHEVDGGQGGRFQAVVQAPLRASQKLLSGMNNATLAAIGGVEHLEQTADAVREARTGKREAKRPSIRQMLAEKKAEASAHVAPAPEKERKSPEAAL